MLIKYNDDRQAEENYISIGYIDENKVETIDFDDNIDIDSNRINVGDSTSVSESK